MPDSRYDRSRTITQRARELRSYASKTESRLWPRLNKGKLGASFRKQHPIGPYFADYCCVSLKLVVEIDGPLHDRERDSHRDHLMAERGYEVLRFSVQDIDEHFEEVVEAIHGAVQLRLQARAATSRTK